MQHFLAVVTKATDERCWHFAPVLAELDSQTVKPDIYANVSPTTPVRNLFCFCISGWCYAALINTMQ